jgi:hypothetical protein
VGLTFDSAALRAAACIDTLPGDAGGLWATAAQASFPGAVLPVIADGTLTIYAVAESGLEWRKLQPLLLAFTGPTLTDFVGAPSPLDPAQPFEALLTDAGVHSAARLRPGRFKSGDAVVVQALRRLQARLLAAPDLATPRPEPTSRLLARLQDALNAGDVDGAWRTLATLGDELRLDALNLAGLELQILAVTGQWSAIRWHPRFEALAYGAPSPAVAELLLEAIYRTIPERSDPAAESSLDASVVPMVHALLRRAVGSTRDAVLQLSALVAALSPPPTRTSPIPQDTPRIDAARTKPEEPTGKAIQALLAIAASPQSGDPDLDTAAIDAMAALNEPARTELLNRRVFSVLWAELQDRLGFQPPPRNWVSWLRRLEDSDFDAPAYAASGVRDWVLGDASLDPTEAAALTKGLLGVTEGLAAERLADGLPFLLSWARADARWPRPALAPVYLAMLTCMALGSRRGASIMQSAGPLLEGTLQCGLSVAEYRDALDAAGEIARTGLDRSAAFDVLEIVETARSVAPADPIALDAFSLALVAGLAAQSARLTVGQRQALRELAAEVGWTEPVVAGDGQAEDSLAAALAGKSVAIYTLTEGAARNARHQLHKLAPDLRIDLNHDHVGTRALATLAARADLFIIAALSATHAATDFVRARCPSEHLAYAPGKGAASIVRKVEEWAIKHS